MTRNLKSALTVRLCAAGALSLMFVAEAGAAEVLMGNRAWGFSNQTSRASIAALMMQHDAARGVSVGAGDAFVCGGGGESTSTANYTCIIMNNSTGSINADQNNSGNQTSSTDTDISVNGSDEGSLSDALKALQ